MTEAVSAGVRNQEFKVDGAGFSASSVQPQAKEYHPIDRNRRNALRGMGLFIYASMFSPNSTYAQGARIAEKCKLSGDDPQVLKSALLESQDLLKKVARKANRYHKARTEKGAVPPVTPKIAGQVLNVSFNYASQLMFMDASELKGIY